MAKLLHSINDFDFERKIRDDMDPQIVLYRDYGSKIAHIYEEDIMERVALKFIGHINFHRAYVEENERSVTDLNLTVFPCLVMFDGGMLRAVLPGPQSFEDIRLWIQENL